MNNQNCHNNYANSSNHYNNSNNNNNNDYNILKHVHEFTGSTEIIRECEDCHNHRFCTLSDEAIRTGNSHIHEVSFNTDFADGHSHEFCGKTCPAIEVGNGKHIHFISDCTESENGHLHKFQATSLIESPTDFYYK